MTDHGTGNTTRPAWGEILAGPRPRSQRRLKKAHRKKMALARLLMALGVILIVSCPIIACYPFIQQQLNMMETNREAEQVVAETTPQTNANREALQKAREYNQRLADGGQQVLGEQADPFTKKTDGDFSGSDDHEYMSLLDENDGIMGVIRVPSISVKLPIRHGASAEILDQGAGHLHGSSLPVGGKSSHAVITGHRGENDKTLFTRLGELTYGDFMYVQVEGETIAYEVDRISVVNPDQVDELRIVPGEDRLTLMTCTPIGVNTQRLLVSGKRSEIPFQAPPLEEAPPDYRRMIVLSIVAGTVVLVGAGTTILLVRWVRRRPLAETAGVPSHREQ